MGELSIIEAIKTRADRYRSGAVALGIGDDCAILRPPTGHEMLVTTDFSLEGRHFTRDRHSPQSIGHRALTRGLSDLAAMGAKPLAAFLSLALPPGVARKKVWLPAFLDGLLTLAAEHKVPLAGGDTSKAPDDHILIDIVLLGSAPRATALRRSGAHPGDALYVTGALGGAAGELERVLAAKRPLRRTATSPHLFPEPRLAVGAALRSRKLASACIDLSDGLSTDLAHLCTASNVSAELNLARLPLGGTLEQALHGGEDYELLFTSSTKLPLKIAGVPVTRIGTITRKRAVQVTQISADGERSPLIAHGWEHLR